jgi:hypothetical protein
LIDDGSDSSAGTALLLTAEPPLVGAIMVSIPFALRDEGTVAMEEGPDGKGLLVRITLPAVQPSATHSQRACND